MNNQLGILDLIELLNLGLQVYDIQLNHKEIGGTFDRLKRIEDKQDEILELLKNEKGYGNKCTDIKRSDQ